MNWPKSIIGWLALIAVVVIIWKNPHAAGHFVFVTVPSKFSAFFGNI